MKKFLSLLAALSILLSFSACSEKNSREKEEAELDAVSSSMTGTLTSYTGSEVSIETEDGQKLSFEDCSSAVLIILYIIFLINTIKETKRGTI